MPYGSLCLILHDLLDADRLIRMPAALRKHRNQRETLDALHMLASLSRARRAHIIAYHRRSDGKPDVELAFRMGMRYDPFAYPFTEVRDLPGKGGISTAYGERIKSFSRIRDCMRECMCTDSRAGMNTRKGAPDPMTTNVAGWKAGSVYSTALHIPQVMPGFSLPVFSAIPFGLFPASSGCRSALRYAPACLPVRPPVHPL